MMEQIRTRIATGAYPGTVAEAQAARAAGDAVGAGLFEGLISAPRRTSHRLAAEDVSRSAALLGLELPAPIKGMRGLQAAEAWEAYLRAL